MRDFIDIVLLILTLLGFRAAKLCNIRLSHTAIFAKDTASRRTMRAILYCVCAAIQILAAAIWLYLSMVLPSWVNVQSSPAEDASLGCTSRTRAIVLKVPMLASGIVLNPALIACPCSATMPYHVSRTAVMSATLLQRAFQWPQWLVNLLWLLTCANQLSAQACSYICQAVVASMWIYATSVMGTQCKWTYTTPLSQAVQAAISLEVPSSEYAA